MFVGNSNLLRGLVLCVIIKPKFRFVARMKYLLKGERLRRPEGDRAVIWWRSEDKSHEDDSPGFGPGGD